VTIDRVAVIAKRDTCARRDQYSVVVNAPGVIAVSGKKMALVQIVFRQCNLL
jgi:hypothetical protein